mgnify:CR=1 FL=1
MRQPFPFSAIVGQDEMKRALTIAAVDPSVGGVLVFGDRGTGKSTAVRGLAGRRRVTRVGAPRPDRPRRCPLPVTAWRGTPRSRAAMWLPESPSIHICFSCSTRSSVQDIAGSP